MSYFDISKYEVTK